MICSENRYTLFRLMLEIWRGSKHIRA